MDHTLPRSNVVSTSPVTVVALAVLALALLTATLTARLTGYDASATPSAPVVASRLLSFSDTSAGAVLVHDANSGALLATVAAGEGSFLRGVVRSLVRQRRGLGAAPTAFELARLADGRMTLTDRETGEHIDLVAFGPTNVAAFATLLDASGTAASPTAPFEQRDGATSP